MSNGRGFVELGRRFRKLDPRSRAEALALDSYTTAQWGGSSLLSWDDLLKERLVVLLGEPGSGKTWEMEERVRLLNATGRCAFFIRLERLVTEPLGQVLAPVDAQRFEAWHKGTSEAIFFLDSVDETKLHRIADFGTALDKFRNAVGDRGVARASILVSSRISEWRPESDAHAVRTRVRLPPRSSRSETKTERDSLDWIGSPAARSEAQETLEPKKEDTAGDDPLVVQVVPLNRTQVQALAAATISDVQGFVAALDTYHAWEFARRPIDVTDLINYWNTHEKLGPLRVLIEHDIQCKLRETTARATVAVLSEQKAREGAEALAACVVFSRQFSFRIRDEGFVSDSPGLEPDTCLPSDWKPEEIPALLNRPILDSASYGHIRFHHRRVVEYLAAQWLQRRMRSGCPASVLHDLLFADAHTAKQVRPALAPVAAWLCIGDQPWHADVRADVLSVAPWIHAQFGDPDGLPLEYRRQLLQRLAPYYADRQTIWLSSDRQTLARFAAPELADDILELIRDKAVSPDLRELALELARQGRLSSCLDAALAIVADTAEPNALKMSAVAVIRDAGTPDHLRQLAGVVCRFQHVPSKLCTILCRTLFPSVLDAAELGALLAKVECKPHSGFGLAHHLNAHFENALDANSAGATLGELVRLCHTAPFLTVNGKQTTISAKYSWLAKAFPSVLVHLFEKPILDPHETADAAETLWILNCLRHSDNYPHDIPKNLEDLTYRYPQLRRLYFWRFVEAKRNERPPHYYWSGVYDSEVLNLRHTDFGWLVEMLHESEATSDREQALEFAFGLWLTAGRARRDACRIGKAVQPDPHLSQLWKQKKGRVRHLRLRQLWHHHVWNKIGEKWWWKRQGHVLQEKWIWLKGERVLLMNLRRLGSGERWDWLYHLVNEASYHEKGNHWPPNSWNGLRKYRNPWIARATEAGCKRFWRTFHPLLPHEKPERNRTDGRVIADDMVMVG